MSPPDGGLMETRRVCGVIEAIWDAKSLTEVGRLNPQVAVVHSEVSIPG